MNGPGMLALIYIDPESFLQLGLGRWTFDFLSALIGAAVAIRDAGDASADSCANQRDEQAGPADRRRALSKARHIYSSALSLSITPASTQ